MSPADKRVAELLDRWLASVELHARYLELDDAAYAKAQDWPKHQRPTKWVVDLARARLLDLKRHLAERQAKDDGGFADALELMSFLTTLLGSEHIERFIPLAVPPATEPVAGAGSGSKEAEKSAETSATTVVRPRGERRTVRRPAASRSASRAPKSTTAAMPPSDAPAVPAPPARPVAASTPPPTGPAIAAVDNAAATVIADAVRLLTWGREWPQLAGLIARLADRPAEKDVWEILRAHRGTIEAQAKRPVD